MPKIIWMGNKDWELITNGKQEWDAEIRSKTIPDGAVVLRRPSNIFSGLTPYIIVPAALCFAAVFAKRALSAEPFLSIFWLPLSFVLGFITALPLHELFHALCYPRTAKVYIGVSLRRLRAFAVSIASLSRNRFILMSLAPSFFGIVFMTIFLICPVSEKWLITLCLLPMFMGLISPAPDYRDVRLVLKQVPKEAVIQPTEGGYIWYCESKHESSKEF